MQVKGVPPSPRARGHPALGIGSASAVSAPGFARPVKRSPDPKINRCRLRDCILELYMLNIYTKMTERSDIALRIGPISPAVSGPLYQQIVSGFKREIGEGRLGGGTPLPSFRLLAEQLLVSIITVRRAYEELEREGIIYRRQGLGTFVAAAGRERSREAKRGHAKALIRLAIQEAMEAGLSPAQAKAFVSRVTTETLSEEKACKAPTLSKSAA